MIPDKGGIVLAGQKTGADLLVQCLQAEGVTHVFGLIGSACIDITDSIYRMGLKFIPAQHEMGAVFAADGYARVTGLPGVALVTVGPGATNALTGVAQAYVESSPVILISGEVATTVRGKGRSNWHEIDQLEVFRPVTKHSVRIERADRIPEIMCDVFRAALTGRPGPVYVGVPRDVQVHMTDLSPAIPGSRRPSGRCRGDREAVRRAAAMLSESSKPFMLLGGGVIWSGAGEEARLLAELINMPAASTAHHRGIIPDDHPLGLGQLGTAATPPAFGMVRDADLIMAVGCTFSEVTTDRYGHNILPDVPIIHVDIDPGEIGKSYRAEVGIVGDAKSVLTDIIEELKISGGGSPEKRDKWAGRAAELKESWRQQLAETAALGKIINRASVVTSVRRALPREAIILSEAGGTCSYSRFALECYRPLIIPGDFSAMGSGLGMAIGAKLACPDLPVVTISGDGAMMMALPELFTAVENRVAIVALVIHNDVYSNIKHKQEKIFGGRFIGVDHQYPSFAEIARTMGAYAETVDQKSEIIPALRRALAAGKTALVEVMLDPGDRVVPSKTYSRWVMERQMPQRGL